MSENTTTEKAKEPVEIPAGAKQPEDHKAKSETVPEQITVTVREHEFTVSSDALDDFELLDDLNELEQNENPGRLPSVLKRLVGEDQWKEAMKVLRGPNGRVRVEDGAEFVGELLEAINPNS